MDSANVPFQSELLGHDDRVDARPAPGIQGTFASLLRRLRDERGLSKADLAKKAGIDPSSVTRFEQGSRAPERETILQLSEAMVLPARDRDRLLASAGFRSDLWDDPLLVELAYLLADDGIDGRARGEVRSVVRMGIAFLKLQRLQGDQR